MAMEKSQRHKEETERLLKKWRASLPPLGDKAREIKKLSDAMMVLEVACGDMFKTLFYSDEADSCNLEFEYEHPILGHKVTIILREMQ